MNQQNEKLDYGGISDRMLKLRKSLNMSQLEFGEAIGFSQDTISIFERKKRNPHKRVIKAIIKEFGISEIWIKYGKGEMYEDITKNLEIHSTDVERLIGKILKLDDKQLHSVEGLIDNCIALYERASSI